jgi:hypothetical protein
MTEIAANGNGDERHVLLVANETVGGRAVFEAVKRRADEGPIRVTVVAPINHPRQGYVIYEDTRRAAAGRRLDRRLREFRQAGIPAHGLVVDADPVNAVRDAIAQLEPDEVIISTHPQPKSGWLRRDLIGQVRKACGKLDVEHVVVDLEREPGGDANVLVVANETVIGKPLLDRIRDRARRGGATFLIISPQSDPSQGAHPEAERRLRRALTELRSEGIEAHGQVAHPDPFTAAMHAVEDERIDEIIVSTFAPGRSPWIRRNLVQRLHNETRLPVEHVVVQPEEVGATGAPA